MIFTQQHRSIIESCQTALQLETCRKWVDNLFTGLELINAINVIEDRQETIQAMYMQTHTQD